AVTACATGVHAIGDAARLIMWGDADVMVAGGAEAAVCELGIAGFCASRALSTGFNDQPTKASRPWDKDRDGFVMGEGAGILLLEDLETAQQRGATILAEMVGYGMSGGAFRVMRNSLRDAKLEPGQIDYINAHGTSTDVGDRIETLAIRRTFGDHAY